MPLHCGQFKLDLSRPLVMGIVNVTPDSFSDGGRGADAALRHALELLEQGADILDIGGESTRPGAAPVSEQQELDRVLPVLEGLRGVAVPLSIDTYKPVVMRAALAAGASMVNDVDAFQADGAFEAVADSGAALCVMHRKGSAQTMQLQPSYEDVVAEVMAFLHGRIVAAQQHCIARDRIVVDPGFGFGKTLEHNLTLLRELDALSCLGVPVLAGISRKSMIGMLTGRDVEQRAFGSVAAALMAVEHGARIVRVHDVAGTVDALKVWQAVRQD
ncbi:dihydropteroate synthase [Ferriphaselus sp. R-1]|uniref:dihydropteroate synthase n=1 Tax=Ferriphaselus sp. R-1 TaxID=1485544 RepID=UPI000556FAB4|nr:dihydropteroate synthase [Ferriphaselus sp. R-1]